MAAMDVIETLGVDDVEMLRSPGWIRVRHNHGWTLQALYDLLSTKLPGVRIELGP